MEKKNQVNIPSSIEDLFYRYKMPRMQLKTEGKGNGIKTNIMNLYDVAKSLRVPAEYPLKFMGHDLGTQTIYKEKGNEITTVINGLFSEDAMRKSLDKFIEKYVICSKCKLPELILHVKKGIISGACNACGAKNELDNAHRLASFIVKNPPKNLSEVGNTIDDKANPKDAKEKGKKSGKSKKKDKNKKDDSDEHNEEEKTEVKAEALHPEVFDIASKKTFEDIESLRKVYEEIAKDCESFEESPEKPIKLLESINLLELNTRKQDQLFYMIFQAIFDVNIAKQIKKNSLLLTSLIEKLHIKKAEIKVLINLEHFMLVQHKENSYEKYIPTILKFFYDEDLLSEEFLLDWDEGKLQDEFKKNFLFNEEIDNAFKKSSEEILKWLKS